MNTKHICKYNSLFLFADSHWTNESEVGALIKFNELWQSVDLMPAQPLQMGGGVRLWDL